MSFVNTRPVSMDVVARVETVTGERPDANAQTSPDGRPSYKELWSQALAEEPTRSDGSTLAAPLTIPAGDIWNSRQGPRAARKASSSPERSF